MRIRQKKGSSNVQEWSDFEPGARPARRMYGSHTHAAANNSPYSFDADE
jgi:hypothetical protein